MQLLKGSILLNKNANLWDQGGNTLRFLYLILIFK